MQKQNYRCRIEFENRWIAPGALLAGIAFFLLMAYYFGVVNFTRCGFMEIVFSMFLPILLLIAYMVLLKGFRHPSVPLYSGIIMLHLLMLVIQVILEGGIFNIIFSVLFYLACIVVSFGVVHGYLAEPKMMSIAFFLAAGWRLLFAVIPQIFKLKILACIPDLAGICALVAYGFFALSVEIVKTKRKRLRSE